MVDGDTFDVFVDGVPERVRLIGIDTPEAGECLAEEAAARLAELVSTGEVRLVPDRSERDQYGRLLRYVDLDDGRSANAVLVAEGLALARSYPPDTARDDELDEAQRSAQADGIGLWAGDSCGAPSAAALEVVGFNADPPGDDSLVLGEEWVVVRNTGTETVDLTGWGLRDESASKRYSFPDGFRLDGGQEVTIRSGCGDDTERDLHWCVSGSAIWNNTGDTAFLLDPTGNIHHSLGY